MSNAGVVLEQVAILFLVMVVGYIANKVKIMGDVAISSMTSLVLMITMPCLVITSFQFDFSDEIMHNVILIAIGALVTHVAMILLGKLVFYKVTRARRIGLWFATIFPNAAFVGYPVLNAVYGKIGMLYGAVYVAFFNIFLWTAGVMIFTGEKNLRGSLKTALLNPGLLATVLGVILFMRSIQLPGILEGTLTMIGGLTTPLSMLLVGARLGSVKLGKIFSSLTIYLFALWRLILLPVLVFAICSLIGFPAMPTGVLTVIAAMPAAANTMLFAERYQLNAPFASQLVFLSTVISVLSVPLLLWILGI